MILTPVLSVRNSTVDGHIDEGYELMLQVNDPVKAVKNVRVHE